MMLHTKIAAPAVLEDTVLRGMFAARKAVFVDLLKWQVPVIDGQYEIDQFDDEQATYLVVADPSGQHLASTRLLPTLRPHILGDLYPDLCEAAPVRSAQAFEITRFCLDRALSARERRHARNQLVQALTSHALEHGITTYVAIAEMGWFQQILAFGWRCLPLGLPRRLGGDLLIAFRIEIDAATPAKLAAAGILSDALQLPSKAA